MGYTLGIDGSKKLENVVIKNASWVVSDNIVNSEIYHADEVYAGSIINTYIYNNHFGITNYVYNPYICNCIIENCDYGVKIVEVESVEPIIIENTKINNCVFGIYYEESSELTIENCSIMNSSNVNIYLDGEDLDPTIKNSVISGGSIGVKYRLFSQSSG